MELSTTNRNTAYIAILDKLSEKKLLVYNTIKALGCASLQNIADYLNCDRSDISGRVTELKSMCLIKEKISAKSRKTGNNVTVYVITSKEERAQLVQDKTEALKGKVNEYEDDFSCFDMCDLTKELLNKEISKLKKQIKMLGAKL